MNRTAILALSLSLVGPVVAADPAGPQQVRYRVTGLFAPSREADLKEAVAAIPHVGLVAVDFDAAEIEVEFAPAKAFPGAKPDQIVKQFDERIRAVSHSTFGIHAVTTVPWDKLERVEIGVAGLDCKACELAAYEAVAKLDGVVQATASFKEGKVVARIDPARTDREKLEAALKQRGVTLKPR